MSVAYKKVCYDAPLKKLIDVRGLIEQFFEAMCFAKNPIDRAQNFLALWKRSKNCSDCVTLYCQNKFRLRRLIYDIAEMCDDEDEDEKEASKDDIRDKLNELIPFMKVPEKPELNVEVTVPNMPPNIYMVLVPVRNPVKVLDTFLEIIYQNRTLVESLKNLTHIETTVKQRARCKKDLLRQIKEKTIQSSVFSAIEFIINRVVDPLVDPQMILELIKLVYHTYTDMPSPSENSARLLVILCKYDFL